MDKKYYTITELSKKLGVSRQTIYNIFNQYFAKYCKVIDGKKQIGADALEDAEVIQKFTARGNPIDGAVLSDSIMQCFDLLKEQLAVKDKQIEGLQKQVAELIKAFRDAQALHAGTIQRELSDNITNKRWWNLWRKRK